MSSIASIGSLGVTIVNWDIILYGAGVGTIIEQQKATSKMGGGV